ncbi:unnamed protein product [Rotaria sordida]|uniref:TIR domain-containing protein n=1 Tax=Rotaria sordida TaxID=392033 RepID=A0A818VQJ6_9BILA|nr:unnamed protein product [Rotaria sordida]CAF3714465.1 unnamed protein product [Rotaria sordida]
MTAYGLIDELKSLSSSQSESAYCYSIEHLTTQLEHMISANVLEGDQLAWILIDHLHQLIPLFEMKLFNDISVQQTNFFLKKLNQFFQQRQFLCGAVRSMKDHSQQQKVFYNYFSLLKISYFESTGKYDNIITCIIPIISVASIFVRMVETDIPSNFLPSLLDFIESYWQNPDRELVMRYTIGLIKVFSKSPSLVLMIIQHKWPNACLRYLSNINEINTSKSTYHVHYILLVTLQKLARHTIGVQILNELNCHKILYDNQTKMQNIYNEHEYFQLQLISYMIDALLMSSDEIKQQTISNNELMSQILDQLVRMIIEGSHSIGFLYDCFHISEPLIVLSKLFVNDDILTICLAQNDRLFQCFTQLFSHFSAQIKTQQPLDAERDSETILAVSNILWSISFQERYHEYFKMNTMLMNTLSNLAQSSSTYDILQSKLIPYDLYSVKKSVQGILWNLKTLSIHSRSSGNVSSTEQRPPLIMISYSHSDTSFCRELVECLSVHVPIWVDYKQADNTINHSDDLWEEIAYAMEMATVIIVIVSKEYYESKSCRQELCYASDTLKKRIIPVYVPNQQYRANGWLGIRIAGQRYIHFGRKLFVVATEELISMIIDYQKSTQTSVITSQPLVTNETIPKPINDTKSDVLSLNDWTSKEVRQWFEENHIHPDLISLFIDQFHTGTALLIYAQHLKYFYRHEYVRILTKYHQVLDGKHLDTLDFVTFVDALFRLREKYNPNNSKDDLERSSEIQLPWTDVQDRITWL